MCHHIIRPINITEYFITEFLFVISYIIQYIKIFINYSSDIFISKNIQCMFLNISINSFTDITPYISSCLFSLVLMSTTFLMEINNSLFFKYTSFDSLLSTAIFIGTSITKKYMLNIDFTNIDHKISINDRYICYLLLQCIYYLINIVTWYRFDNLLYYTFLLIIFPTNINYIFKFKYVSKIFEIIYKKINRTSRFYFFKLFTYLINNICISIINYNPNITIKEMKYYFRNRSSDSIIQFFKILIISFFIQHLESVGSYYGMVLNYVYITNNNTYDNEFIKQIFYKRDWDLLFDVSIIKYIITTYKNSSKNHLYKYFNSFAISIELSLARFFAFHTLCSIFNNPIITVVLLITTNISDIYYVTINLMSLILFKLNVNYIIIAFISQLYGLMLNNITKLLLNDFYTFINKNKYFFIHENKYNLFVVVTMIINTLIYNYSRYTYIILLLISCNSKFPLISLLFTTIPILSYFSLVHQFVIFIIFYIIVNIYQYDTYSPLKKINFIGNYLTNDFMNESVIVTKKNHTYITEANYFDINVFGNNVSNINNSIYIK